ncbi:hypothetical protein AB4K20DRAFT_1927559 [Rhizopus microsporus]
MIASVQSFVHLDNTSLFSALSLSFFFHFLIIISQAIFLKRAYLLFLLRNQCELQGFKQIFVVFILIYTKKAMVDIL